MLNHIIYLLFGLLSENGTVEFDEFALLLERCPNPEDELKESFRVTFGQIENKMQDIF